MKSQRKAGDPPPETPGASIEAYFKPIAIMVDGTPGSRPIDQLLANLNELYRQLVLAAENSAQAKQALEQVDVQVASLRANATRLPQPLAGMIDKVAKDAAGDANASSVAQLAGSRWLAENVTGTLPADRRERQSRRQQRPRCVAGRFRRGVCARWRHRQVLRRQPRRLSSVPAARRWVWKPNPKLSRKLSDPTLRPVRRPADIRDAFFPTGGNAPNIRMEVKPLTLSSDAQTATLSINGANVVQSTGRQRAGNVQWPGAGAGDASIAMAPDMPDRKSSLERTGAWALFRLIDAGSSIESGNAFKVSFVVFGREVSYQFTSSSLTNPLSMPSLRQFKCPNGL